MTKYNHSDVLKLSYEIFGQLKKAINGKDSQLIKIITALLAGGHIIIEDVPGVGKTTLALSLAKTLSLDTKRVQFTPDLMPSDIMGFSLYNSRTETFEFHEGACMTNILLADEINRASSRTQSALLEIMEEKKVTVDGVTNNLPSPFFVVATQNPVDSAGTQPLPESQLDRFLMKTSLNYPQPQDEIQMLKSHHAHNPLEDVEAVTDKDEFMLAMKTVEQTFIDDDVYKYMVNLSNATRKNSGIRLGLSPRATLAMAGFAKAAATINGRDFVLPDDVKFIFADVAGHRCTLSQKARADGESIESLLEKIIAQVPSPTI